MSREQDLLFCKIAVANGLVSEDQAKKVIAMANQREAETGRRPLVGAIFSKYNLISQPDVQALYQAVGKRLGGNVAMPGTVPSSGRGAAKRVRGGGKGRGGRRERRPTKVDPKTLWMGIGFGVVFIGVVVGMIVLWIVYPGSGSPDDKVKETAKAKSAAASRASSEAADSTPTAEEAAAADAAKLAKQEMVPEQEGILRQLLSDAQRLLIEDQPDRAVAQLEDALKKIESKSIFVYPALLADLKSTLATAKTRAAGGEADGGGNEGALPEDDLGDL